MFQRGGNRVFKGATIKKKKKKKKKKTEYAPHSLLSFKSNPSGNKNHSEGHKSEKQPQLKYASKSAVFLYHGRISLFLKDPFFPDYLEFATAVIVSVWSW